MFKVTKIYKRPNTDVNFFNPFLVPDSADGSPGPQGHYHTNYVVTGKVISATNIVSEDGLTLTTVVLWDDEASWLAFKADPVMAVNIVDASINHNTNNGITATLVTETV